MLLYKYKFYNMYYKGILISSKREKMINKIRETQGVLTSIRTAYKMFSEADKLLEKYPEYLDSYEFTENYKGFPLKFIYK